MMLPRLLPSSATDVESDSDSLASPLDAPIAHVNIARRSSYRLLESPVYDISRPLNHFDTVQGLHAPYVITNGYDAPYEVGCSQAQHPSTGSQTVPIVPPGLYGLAPYPSGQDDSHQYSAVSDSAIHHRHWDYLQENDYPSDSPTSAVSEPFFAQHDRGDYIHGFESQYSAPTADYEPGGAHPIHSSYSNVACDAHTCDYPAAPSAAEMPSDFAAQQQSMSICETGGDYAHYPQGRQPVSTEHNVGGQYLYSHSAHPRLSPHSYPGRGQNHNFGEP
ncbi:uncharacterized protein C8Q71DRAFT_450396 [Rhodofomes roseus]|uniref:Uncharacterized protein n=1 Tax=Rhodofomes roseus TaxID=34475 RepID=A0ABQ8JYM4_9APHY|nr:uncharacterized protein C8Q71DRAFT_450396 [Rhodofomes roseus]KAH9829122.1 hypothetical protein C8Q71DRAFT_450396 [Rhodofomes roseus]